MENPVAPTGKPAEKPTILVVDDSPENLLLTSDLLKKHYKVKVANHGGRALILAQTHPAPRLILLDVMMPGLDGYEICQLLKSNPATQSIPVVFLSARADEDKKGRDVGAVGYLTKPVKSSLLMECIQTHLAPQAHIGLSG